MKTNRNIRMSEYKRDYYYFKKNKNGYPFRLQTIIKRAFRLMKEI